MWSHFDVFELKTGTQLLSIDFRQIGARAVGGKGTEFCAGGVVGSDGNPVVLGNDGVIRVLDKSTCKVTLELQPRPPEEFINHGLWASGRDRIVGRGDLDIHFWDSRTGNRIQKWNARGVIAMDVSPLGNHDVVTIHDDHMIREWNVASGQQKGELPDASKRRNNIRFSRDGVRLLTWASGGRDFYLFDPDRGVEITFPGDLGEVRQVAAFPDVPVLVSGGSDGIVRLWDENQVEPILQEKCLAPVNQVLISKDGNHLVVTLEREIIFYRVEKIRAKPRPRKTLK
jgi:WD40 repeat protein